MCRLFLTVLIVAVFTLYLCEVAEAVHNCGPNKIWDNCGSACPPTCEAPDSKPCTKQCVIGCRCQPGLFAQPDGSCIESSECP